MNLPGAGQHIKAGWILSTNSEYCKQWNDNQHCLPFSRSVSRHSSCSFVSSSTLRDPSGYSPIELPMFRSIFGCQSASVGTWTQCRCHSMWYSEWVGEHQPFHFALGVHGIPTQCLSLRPFHCTNTCHTSCALYVHSCQFGPKLSLMNLRGGLLPQLLCHDTSCREVGIHRASSTSQQGIRTSSILPEDQIQWPHLR